MDKRYVVFKCGIDGRAPIAWFDASGIDEANDNLHWLKTKHASEKRFHLDKGEFFEILEKSQMEAAEWEAAIVTLRLQGGKA